MKFSYNKRTGTGKGARAASANPYLSNQSTKIVKVERRAKRFPCLSYAETHPIFNAKQSKIVKVERRAKRFPCLSFAETHPIFGEAKDNKS